jgi:hypothetical protein
VAATAVGGIPEIVVDGDSGLLVEPGSAAAMADAVDYLPAGWSRSASPGTWSPAASDSRWSSSDPGAAPKVTDGTPPR